MIRKQLAVGFVAVVVSMGLAAQPEWGVGLGVGGGYANWNGWTGGSFKASVGPSLSLGNFGAGVEGFLGWSRVAKDVRLMDFWAGGALAKVRVFYGELGAGYAYIPGFTSERGEYFWGTGTPLLFAGVTVPLRITERIYVTPGVGNAFATKLSSFYNPSGSATVSYRFVSPEEGEAPVPELKPETPSKPDIVAEKPKATPKPKPKTQLSRAAQTPTPQPPKTDTTAAKPPAVQKPVQTPPPVTLPVSPVPAQPPVAYAPSRKPYALVIGVGTYQSSSIPALRYSEDDALAIYQALVDTARGALPRERVRLATGAKATATAFRRDLTWLVNNARAEDVPALLYYSGHGAPSQGVGGEFRQAYLVPFDCDPDYLEETAIPVKDVESKLASLSTQSLVALDACFSGKGRSITKPGSKGVTLVPRNLGLEEGPRGVAFMTASKADQISTEYETGRHGLFTYFLLDGLSGSADEAGNADGWVDAGEAYAYVKDRVRSEATRMNLEQEPELIGDASGLTLACNRGRLLLLRKDVKVAKVNAAYQTGRLSAGQFDRAVKEINLGTESKVLSDFLSGEVSIETFGQTY